MRKQSKDGASRSSWAKVSVLGVAFVAVCIAGGISGWVLYNSIQGQPVFNADANPPVVTVSPPEPATETPEASDPLINISDDKIFQNISAAGVDLSGLTRDEAEAKLSLAFDQDLAGVVLTFERDGQTVKRGLADLGGRYDAAATAEKAYGYARSGDYNERYAMVSSLVTKGVDIEPIITFDDEKLNLALKDLGQTFVQNPSPQGLKRENGQFVFTPGKAGTALDTAQMAQDVKEAAKAGGTGSAVPIGVVYSDLPVNALDLNKATSLLGSFRSNFVAGATGRNQNLKNAASKINNVMLLPGEVFSMNDALGEMTTGNGYAVGQAIVGGKLVDDIGGGVCQVSGTLYNAVLYSELKIVQRQNHSQKVTYLDYAFDATLASPSIDFKFENSTDYPILIEGYIDGSQVVVNIYGNETRESGRTLMFENAFVSSVQPGPDQIKYDPNLPEGVRQVEISAKTGYTYYLYKLIYQNGTLKDKVQVNTSTYRAQAAVVHVGTGPAASGATAAPPAADPTQTPAETAPESTTAPVTEPTPEPETEPAPEAPPQFVTVPPDYEPVEP